jgi:hypothetical protein
MMDEETRRTLRDRLLELEHHLRGVSAALHAARTPLPTEPDPREVAAERLLLDAQRQHLQGATHDCGDWRQGFRCMVCGEWID